MQEKLRFFFLFFKILISRHKKYIFGSAATGFFLTLISIQIYAPLAAKIYRKPQVVAVIGRYTEKNLPQNIKNQLSLGLTTLLPDGEASPSLAYKWTIENDGKTYILDIHENIFWHNGQTFKAGDVEYSLAGAKLKPLDDRRLQIDLSSAYAPLLNSLSAPLFKNNLIGLGPYKAEKISYKEDYLQQLVLVPNHDDKLPNITYKFYDTPDEARLAFKLGYVNMLMNLASAADFQGWKNVKITSKTVYDKVITVLINLKDPLFKEKEVRQALWYGMPEFPDYEKAISPISPLSWAFSNKIRLYKYNPENAKKVLVEGSFASGSGELTLSTFPSLIDTAQKITESLNSIGVKTRLKVERSYSENFQLFLVELNLPSDPDQYQFWQSTQSSTNLTNYTNLKIDKLLEDGRRTLDKEKRMKIYADFQRYLVDDVPAIFLYYPKVYTVSR